MKKLARYAAVAAMGVCLSACGVCESFSPVFNNVGVNYDDRQEFFR